MQGTPLSEEQIALLPPANRLGETIVVAFGADRWSDRFDDLLGYATFAWGRWAGEVWPGTTDPGVGPRTGKSAVGVHKDGVARIDPGYYKGVYAFGFHKGDRKHPALVQRGPVDYRRWKGKQWGDVENGVRGFNVHRSAWERGWRVGDFSHGCLVFQNRLHHWAFLQAIGYPEHGFRATEMQPPNGLLDLYLFRAQG